MGDVSFLTIDTTGKNISSRNGQFLGEKMRMIGLEPRLYAGSANQGLEKQTP